MRRGRLRDQRVAAPQFRLGLHLLALVTAAALSACSGCASSDGSGSQGASDPPPLQGAPTPEATSSSPDPEANADAAPSNAGGDEPHDRARAAVAPAPPPDEPASPAAIEAWLAEADVALHGLGVDRKPSSRAHGPLPEGSGLDAAYAEGRAQAYYSRPDKVVAWFLDAKFGPDGGGDPRGGPLAGYELHLVGHDDERAYLHVVVPRFGVMSAATDTGSDSERGAPSHASWVRGDRWGCLCDVVEAGKDYTLFKTDGGASPRRQWGHVWVLEDLATLAREYASSAGVPLGIGDLSLALGGKISDHWTHRRGVDADVYLLIYPQTDRPDGAGETSDADAGATRPFNYWHTQRKDASRWTRDDEGRRGVEPEIDGASQSSLRLEQLAEAALTHDRIWFFVHDAVTLLEPFDQRAQSRKPGRRYLHAKNRAYWPAHRDHVHIRWSDRSAFPVDVPPKP